jgi:hypothetical protein
MNKLKITEQNEKNKGEELKNQKLSIEISNLLNQPNNRIANIYADSTIKKNNALEPTILTTELSYNTTNGLSNHVKLAIGIKTIIHSIPSGEMCYYIPDTLIKKRLVFRFIQWTTGEIKFMRDFILDLDNVKFQATTDKKSVKWWKHLNTRRNAAKVRSLTNRNVNFVPNATIILSTSDIEFMKYKSNIDLRKNTKAAAKVMDYFFLLHLVILDEVEGMVSIFHSDTQNWETVSIDRMKKETRNELKKNSEIKFSR